MNPYCLDGEELQAFVDIELCRREIFDDEYELSNLLDRWCGWDTEIICLATILSMHLEKQQRLNEDANLILSKILTTREDTGLYVTLEGFGEKFVKYFLNQSRNEMLSIDEDLSYLRIQFGEYNY